MKLNSLPEIVLEALPTIDTDKINWKNVAKNIYAPYRIIDKAEIIISFRGGLSKDIIKMYHIIAKGINPDRLYVAETARQTIKQTGKKIDIYDEALMNPLKFIPVEKIFCYRSLKTKKFIGSLE